MSSRTKEQTRKLMLETACELLTERGVPEAIPLKLSDVLHRLELTTGAAYHIWDSQDAFRLDVAHYCAKAIGWPAVDTQLDFEDADGDELPFSTAARQIAEQYFALFNTDEIYTRLYWWTVQQPSEDLAETVKHQYVNDNPFVVACKSLLAAYDREPIEGVSVEEIAVTAVALLEGFSLRYRFLPDSVTGGDSNLFADALDRYLSCITQPAS